MAVIQTGDATITLGSSDMTTKISNFSETGGDANIVSSRGFGKYTDDIIRSHDDWEVKFNVNLDGTDFYEIMTIGSLDEMIVTLGSDPDLLIFTYGNVYIKSITGEVGADNYYKGTITCQIPYYDNTGSLNREVGSEA